MDLLDFFKDAKLKELKKNEVLHSPEEKCVSLGYVLSGKIVLKKYLSTGKELYLTEFHPCEVFGELLVLAEDNYQGWLVAEEPTSILELDAASLNSILKKSSFRLFFFKKISERVSGMTKRIETLSYRKVSDRLILYLLNSEYPERIHILNISSLAEELDCSREALSRALSDIEKSGAVKRVDGGIKIEDQVLLEGQFSVF